MALHKAIRQFDKRAHTFGFFGLVGPLVALLLQGFLFKSKPLAAFRKCVLVYQTIDQRVGKAVDPVLEIRLAELPGLFSILVLGGR